MQVIAHLLLHILTCNNKCKIYSSDYDWGVVAKAALLRHDSDEFASWSMGAIADERLRIHKPKPTSAAKLRVPSYVVFV